MTIQYESAGNTSNIPHLQRQDETLPNSINTETGRVMCQALQHLLYRTSSTNIHKAMLISITCAIEDPKYIDYTAVICLRTIHVHETFT